MSSTVITGIGELITNDPDHELATGQLGLINNAAMIVDDEQIAWVGPAGRAPEADRRIDVQGRCVLPAFVDSHTHLVYAGDRSAEFAARMAGTPYDGGGIAVTVEATRSASDDELRSLLAQRIRELRAQGTGTVEIKSGYGLSVADEQRMLRIAAEFTAETTFLGGHVVPPEARGDRSAYVELVTGEMLAACAPYARWIDVFCEPHSPHAFTEDQSRRILQAGIAAGLLPRVHGNQLGPGPGVRLAVELGAASVDHCTYLTRADIDLLAGSDTVATLLPGVEFCTHSPYPDAGALIDAGVTIALATDCNPGTCNSSSMPLMIALAVRECGLTTEQAIRAATVGAAKSVRREDIGRVGVGCRPELIVLDAPSYLHLPYRVGVPVTHPIKIT
ncbi:imidazolonepropionase [Microlunatus elymi]|uniref:Imidazolonepropionase n=1 Tax=Microlunatus elymi TaxID=2596828 RepID=A0A516Q2W3_9ACTN|nr:imidazolonepropionase [Microlunatus elymi]QDP97769.1 imidazolonepropionase [Microlunatus elymi]